MRFTKIKYDLKEVMCRWTTQRGAEVHDHELTGEAQPHPDFVAALRALKRDVISVCDLPEYYDTDLRVQSVTFSYNEKTGTSGAVVTSLKKLTIASSPLVLNTPYLLEDGDQDTGVMPSGMRRRLETLRLEAELYINGSKRAQGELFVASKEEKRAVEAATEDAEEPAEEPVPGTQVKVDGKWVPATPENVARAAPSMVP